MIHGHRLIQVRLKLLPAFTDKFRRHGVEDLVRRKSGSRRCRAYLELLVQLQSLNRLHTLFTLNAVWYARNTLNAGRMARESRLRTTERMPHFPHRSAECATPMPRHVAARRRARAFLEISHRKSEGRLGFDENTDRCPLSCKDRHMVMGWGDADTPRASRCGAGSPNARCSARAAAIVLGVPGGTTRGPTCLYTSTGMASMIDEAGRRAAARGPPHLR